MSVNNIKNHNLILAALELYDIDLISLNLEYCSQKYPMSPYSTLLDLLKKYEIKKLVTSLNELTSNHWSNSEICKIEHELQNSTFERLKVDIENYVAAKPIKIKNLYLSIYELFSLLLSTFTRITETLENKTQNEKLTKELIELKSQKQYIELELEQADINDEDYLKKYESLLTVEKDVFAKIKSIKEQSENKELDNAQSILHKIIQDMSNNNEFFSITCGSGVLDTCRDVLCSILFQMDIIESITNLEFRLEQPRFDENIISRKLELILFAFVPHLKNINFVQNKLNNHINTLKVISRKIELGEPFVKLDPPLPETFANVKKFRLFDVDGTIRLTTHKGAKILQFEVMAEAEFWLSKFIESRPYKISVNRTPPPLKRAKSCIPIPSLGKRTLVVGGGDISSICRTCNGTGLWGNCRSCGGSGFTNSIT